MSHPIGFAIVGTGMIEDVHAEAIKHSPRAELKAVYSRGAQKCREFAEREGCRAAASIEELVADPEIQAVCVTTPSGAHAEAAIPLLEAGKAVLCEKPLEVSLSAVDSILAAAERGGGLLAGVFHRRLGRGARLLTEAIAAGRFGPLTLCSAYIKWWRAQSYYDSSAWKGTWKLDGGGALMNQGVHAVDLLQWLVGLPREVSAFAATLAHPRVEAEDTLAATLRFPNGALGVIEAATSCYPGSDLRLEILGDKGSATIVDDRIVRWDFAEKLEGDDEIMRPEEGPGIAGGTSDPKAISNEGHRRLVDDLAAAIQQGRAPMIPGSDARKAIALVLAIYESARTGRATPVNGAI